MKKLVINAAMFALFAGLVPSAVVRGDGAAAPATDEPHKIALIDMARVFKQYKKFEAMRDELKGELTKSEDRFKAMAEVIKKEQVELKNFKEGSEEYARVEKSLLTHTSQTDAFRKSQQRELIRKEAQIYKQIYLEVSDAVEKYATHFHITLVLRFSAEDVWLGTESRGRDAGPQPPGGLLSPQRRHHQRHLRVPQPQLPADDGGSGGGPAPPAARHASSRLAVSQTAAENA